MEDGRKLPVDAFPSGSPTLYEGRVREEVQRREEEWEQSQPPKKTRFTDTDAYRRMHPLPKKPPRPRELAKKVAAFADRAESVVRHLPRPAA